MYSTSVDLKQAAQSNNGFGHRGHGGGAAQAPPESAPQGQDSKTLAATHTMHDATTAGATSPSARTTAHSRLFRRPKPHDSASSPADSVTTGSTVNGRVRPAVTATSRLAAHQNYHRFFTPRAKALTSAKQPRSATEHSREPSRQHSGSIDRARNCQTKQPLQSQQQRQTNCPRT
jgi:hypothetical protein